MAAAKCETDFGSRTALRCVPGIVMPRTKSEWLRQSATGFRADRDHTFTVMTVNGPDSGQGRYEAMVASQCSRSEASLPPSVI